MFFLDSECNWCFELIYLENADLEDRNHFDICLHLFTQTEFVKTICVFALINPVISKTT